MFFTGKEKIQYRRFRLKGFWDDMASKAPTLTAVALHALYISPSSADVERTISRKERMVGLLRQKLTQVNVTALLMLCRSGDVAKYFVQ